MSRSVLEQTLPVLTLSAIQSNKVADDDDSTTAPSPTSRTSSSPWVGGAARLLRWADAESDEESDSPSAASVTETTLAPKAKMSTNAVAFTPKAKMSTNASAFMPIGQTQVPKSEMGTNAAQFAPAGEESSRRSIRVDFATVVAAGLKIMRCSSVALSSVVRESANGWSLSCRLRPDVAVANALPTLHSQVQFAMLQAAEVSKMVYIVGYEREPFTTFYDRLGFGLQLAAVRDDSNVCWDLITTGHCGCGRYCRLNHLADQVSVEVRFEL